MAQEQTTSLSKPVSHKERPPQKRYARIAPLYRALIWTSFGINAVLIIIIAVMAGLLITQYRQVAGLTTNVQSFAGANIAELEDVVAKLQESTIVTTIPLDEKLNLAGQGVVVPVDQQTVVTLTEPVPLVLSGADIDLGGGNRLRASSINLTLPAGTPLQIALKMDIPLDPVTIPVQLNVPVNIPLKDTELGPQFERLGAIVDRLVVPAEPLLLRPSVVPDSSLQQPGPVRAEPTSMPAQAAPDAVPTPADPTQNAAPGTTP
jgi:hypothetical protein